MRYYVDCEFNGTGGQLLSIGIVRQDGVSFYAVLPLYQIPDPWVAVHVLPWLSRAPEETALVSARLAAWLAQDSGLHTFVADWPEDLQHLMSLMIKEKLKRYPPRVFRCFLLELTNFVSSEQSSVPHNAMEDALALRDYVEQALSSKRYAGRLTPQERSLLTE